jgi:superfamily II DNA or RNA helicase
MTELRPYQIDVIAEFDRAVAAGQKRIILVLPTGGGKTVIAAEVIKLARAKYERVLFLAHRREIIAQTSKQLAGHGTSLGEHGIIQAGRERDLRPTASIQVASIDTLHHRTNRGAIDLPAADLVIFDEAHRARGRTREALLQKFPDATWLGCTATPCRGDGRGLGNIFQAMIEGPQTGELIRLGYLVPPKVFAPIYRDVAKGVDTAQGDYIASALSRRMNTDELVGDIVTEWLAHGENRPTVAFSVDVAHAVNIRDRFREAGVAAEYVCGTTPLAEREQILAALASGEIGVVANCAVLIEGWDCPPVSCVILARPTKQLGLYKQMVGRGLRICEGKNDCIFLDHSGAVFKHGLPSDDVAWTLDVDRKAENVAAAARKRGEAVEIAKCPECSAILGGPPPCWSCGWQPQPRAREVEFAEGELGLVTNGHAGGNHYDAAARTQWHKMLTWIAVERNYKSGWVAHKYKEKFGIWPPTRLPVTQIEPTPEVRSWVRSRTIAFAKARSAAA